MSSRNDDGVHSGAAPAGDRLRPPRFVRGAAWAIFVAAMLGNLFVGARIYSREGPEVGRDDAYDNIAIFTKVMEQIRRNYVDGSKTDYRDLTYGALRGMLDSLDEHSQFMDPEIYAEMKDDTSGQFGGLGIVIGVRDGMLTIIAPMEDTPGFRAGLLPGDRIIEIDGKPCDGVPLSAAVKLLRGEPGTKVSMRVANPKTRDVRTVEIVRAVISVPSVKDASILEDGIGYVRLVQFNEPTADALEDALAKLKSEGMHALVLDLRNNPGGLLKSAIDVGEKFLNKGDMIVYTQGRDPRERQTYLAKHDGHYRDLPMVLLVNGGSASASEIVSGALQDHRRAILVGEKTFGKGSVQSVIPLDDGSAIRLTTAKYYTPSKRVIHEYGIEPDIVVPMSPEVWQQILRQRANAALETEPAPAETEPGTEEPPDDIQLDRAVDVLKGIMIFRAAAEPGAAARKAAG